MVPICNWNVEAVVAFIVAYKMSNISTWQTIRHEAHNLGGCHTKFLVTKCGNYSEVCPTLLTLITTSRTSNTVV